MLSSDQVLGIWSIKKNRACFFQYQPSRALGQAGGGGGGSLRGACLLDLENGIVMNEAPPLDVFGVWTVATVSSSQVGLVGSKPRQKDSTPPHCRHGACQGSAAVSAQRYTTQGVTACKAGRGGTEIQAHMMACITGGRCTVHRFISRHDFQP